MAFEIKQARKMIHNQIDHEDIDYHNFLAERQFRNVINKINTLVGI